MTPLIELLPRELGYAESPEMTAIQNALTAAMEDVWAARDGFAAQLSPATATWGLDKWEEALGLVPPDRSDLDARRRAVIAKLRGAGTSTVERIMSVAEAQLGGVVWVLEFAREYRIEIWVRSMAIPDGSIKALTGVLKELVPAHLRWSYGVEYPTEPFVNEPGKLLLHRFVMALAFSNRRNYVPVRLDGSVPLDGSWLLDSAPSSMFGFPRFTAGGALAGLRDRLERSGTGYGFALFETAGRMEFPEFRTRTRAAKNKTVFSIPRFKLGGAMARNRRSLAAALTADTMWTLDGSVPLDGSRKLNADIIKEDL